MPLIKTALKQGIIAAQQAAASAGTLQDAQDAYANTLATAIDAYIKSALVTTVITGVSPSGPVTGTGTGSLS